MSALTSSRLAGAAAIPALVLGVAACSSGSGVGADSTEDVAPITPAEAVLASYTGLEGQVLHHGNGHDGQRARLHELGQP